MFTRNAKEKIIEKVPRGVIGSVYFLDRDNDNDGISDSQDDMIDDRDEAGDLDSGIPDWHSTSKYSK